IGCPPSSNTPDSNDVRVRVEGLLKISATVRPSSARDECGAAFSEAARCSRRPSRSASSSAPVRKCDAGIDVEPLPRSQPATCTALVVSRVRKRAGGLGRGGRAAQGGAPVFPEFASALAGWEWDVALLQEVPPWWPEPLARAAGAQARWVLTSRNL